MTRPTSPRREARVLGAPSSGPFAVFDRRSRSWRTAGPGPVEYTASWPRCGAARDGLGLGSPGSGHRPVARGRGSRTWPTPHGMPKRGQRRNPGSSGNELGRAVLRAEAAGEGWPTPTASDARKWSASPPGSRRAKETLSGAVQSRAAEAGRPTPGRLSPMWVEWLMGFPIGWTATADGATAEAGR